MPERIANATEAPKKGDHLHVGVLVQRIDRDARPGVLEGRTVDLITPFVATLLGLGINQGAYTAEVVRSGILSVDTGQTEAAKSIGMTQLVTLRRIVLPASGPNSRKTVVSCTNATPNGTSVPFLNAVGPCSDVT